MVNINSVKISKIATAIGIGVALSGCKVPQRITLDPEISKYFDPPVSREYTKHFGPKKENLSEEDKKKIFRLWETLDTHEKRCFVRALHSSGLRNLSPLIKSSKTSIERMVHQEERFLGELKLKAPKIMKNYDKIPYNDRLFVNMLYLGIVGDTQKTKDIMSSFVQANIERADSAEKILIRTSKHFQQGSIANHLLLNLIAREVKDDGTGYRGENDRCVLADLILSFDILPQDLRYNIMEIFLNGIVNNQALREKIGTPRDFTFNALENPFIHLVSYAYKNPKLVKVSPFIIAKAFTEISDFSGLFDVNWGMIHDRHPVYWHVEERNKALSAFRYQWAKRIQMHGGEALRLEAAIQPYATWFFDSEREQKKGGVHLNYSSIPDCIDVGEVSTHNFGDESRTVFVIFPGFSSDILDKIPSKYQVSKFYLFPQNNDFESLKRNDDINNLIIACTPALQNDFLGMIDPVISDDGTTRLSTIKWLTHERSGIKVTFIFPNDTPKMIEQIIQNRTTLALDLE